MNKRVLRSVMAIVMVLVLAVSIFPVNALAIAIEKNYGVSGLNSFKESATAGNTYKYVALGDSVASGMGVDDDEESKNNYYAMYVDQNYKNAPAIAYPSLTAAALKQALIDDGYITADTLNEKGKVTNTSFDYSNLGASSFMTSDFVNVLTEGSTETSRLWKNTAAQNESLLLGIYEEYGFDRFVYEIENHKEQLKEFFINYYDNYTLSTASAYGYGNTKTLTGEQWLKNYSDAAAYAEAYDWNSAFYYPSYYTQATYYAVTNLPWSSQADRDAKIASLFVAPTKAEIDEQAFYYIVEYDLKAELAMDMAEQWGWRRKNWAWLVDWVVLTEADVRDEMANNAAAHPLTATAIRDQATTDAFYTKAETVLKKEAQDVAVSSYINTWFETWFAAIVDAADEALMQTEMTNLNAYIVYITSGPGDYAQNYQYSKIMRSELAEADLITVHVGANDLLEQLMFDLLDTGLGGYYTSTVDDQGYTHYLNVNNPLMVVIQQTLFQYMGGSALSTYDTPIEYLEAEIEYYRNSETDPITVDHVIELLKFLNASNVEKTLYQYSETAMDNYALILDEINAINPTAEIVLVGSFNPFGISVTYDGYNYTTANIIALVGCAALDSVFGIEYPTEGEQAIDIKDVSYTERFNNYYAAIAAKVAEISKYSPEEMLAFLGLDQTSMSSYMTQIQTILGSGSGVDTTTLLNTVLSSDVIGKISDAGTAMLNTLTNDLTYAIIYTLLGQPAETALDNMNTRTRAYSKEYTQKLGKNVSFVYILDKLDNEANMNPHTLSKGCIQMADAILDTVLPTVAFGSNNANYGSIVPYINGDTSNAIDGTYPLATDSVSMKAVYGTEITFEVLPQSGYKVDKVIAGNEILQPVAGTTNVYKTGKIYYDTYVYVRYVSESTGTYTAMKNANADALLVIGDSIPSGFSFAEYCRWHVNTKVNESASHAYPTLLAEMLGKDVYNMSIIGGSNSSVNAALNNYNVDTYESGNELYPVFMNAVMNSDTAIINLGSNEIYSMVMMNALGILLGSDSGTISQTEFFAGLLEVEQLLVKYGYPLGRETSIIDCLTVLARANSSTFPNAVKLLQTIKDLPSILDNYADIDTEALQRLFTDPVMEEKLDEAMEQYYEMLQPSFATFDKVFGDNTNVKIMGVYKASENLNIDVTLSAKTGITYIDNILDQLGIEDKNIKLSLGSIATEIVDVINGFLKQACAAYGYEFIDMNEIEIDKSSAVDPHPSEEGHQQIAEFLALHLDRAFINVESGKGGTVTNKGENKVTIGDSLSIKVTAASGYTIRCISVDGVKVSDAAGKSTYTYSFTNIRASHTVKVLFNKTGAKYNYYLALGDSTTAGVSQKGYDGDFSNPATAYPQITADLLNITNVDNFGLQGCMVGMTLSSLMDPTGEYHNELVKSISEADIITLNYGMSDLFVTWATKLLEAIEVVNIDVDGNVTNRITGEPLTRDALVPFGLAMMNKFDINSFISNLDSLLGIKLGVKQLILVYNLLQDSNINTIFNAAYTQFTEYYQILYTAIRQLNPNAKVVVIGLYNISSSDWTTMINSQIHYFGKIFVTWITKMNTWLSNFATKNNLTYVSLDLIDLNSFHYVGEDLGTIIPIAIRKYLADPYPTTAGHLEIANRIVSAINKTSYKQVVVNPPVAVDTYYTVTVEIVGNGTATPTNFYKQGDTATISFAPSAGYKISDVLVDGKSVGAVTKYEFASISADHTVKVVFEKSKLSFIDVKDDDYFFNAVSWAVDNGITNGISDTLFGSYNNCTRAQVVTFLWRAAGCPEPRLSVNPFLDVKTTDYFYKAVLWAYENGVVKGVTTTQFKPDNTVTRAQFVAILYRYNGSPVVAGINKFSDVKSADYFYNAVIWASQNGITEGMTATSFGPSKNCVRAQVVTFLYRAFANK